MATLVPGEKARMYALGGLMRGGASRGGYIDGRVYVSIGGSDVGWVRDDAHVGTLISSLSITQQLNEVPDTATLRINAAVPPAGGEVVISLGSQNGRRLFAGYGLTRQQLYAADKPANIQADFSAVDYTWLLAFAKVTKQYRGVSGTMIINDLIATYGAANGFTTTAVQANLPALEITFTDEDVPNAITRLMRRSGGHWYCDYAKDIHAWIGDEPNVPPPTALTPAHPSLADFRATVDQTQALTRCYVEHRGSQLLAGVGPGETILPLEAVDAFVAQSDVFLKVTLPGADGGARHLNFSGVVSSGGGSLVGPGIQPSSAPTLSPSPGTPGMAPGVHQYAYTYVTASGETKPSPIGSIDTAASVPSALVAPVVTQNPPANTAGAGNGSYFTIGSAFTFTYAYSEAADWPDLTKCGTLSPGTTVTAISNGDAWNPTMSASMLIQVPHSADLTVPWIQVFVSENAGPIRQWQALFNVPGNPPVIVSTQGSNEPDTSSAVYPGTAATDRVQISAIAVGPPGTTARKLYRSKANLTPLLLAATIADNTTTTPTIDAAADAALGVVAPSSDTSGLKQPEGTVNPGESFVPVASTAVFRAGGGWAVVAEQALRYTGLTATSLSGVPASGRGAVVGPIQYNTAIRAAPLLTGVATVDETIEAGAEIYAVVRVDDPAAQAQLAARLGVVTGIREEWIQDRRLSYGEAKARGQATLAVRPFDAVSISYRCRDITTSVGRTITVNLPAPTNVTGTFRIQAVTISNFRPHATQPPTFQVQASSTRFTFEDWLRIIKTKE